MTFLPKTTLALVDSFIRKNLCYYSRIYPEDVKKIHKFLEEINGVITLKQFINIRNIFMLMLSKRKGILATRYGTDIINMYKHKDGVIDIANKFQLPPMTVVNQILIELGKESHKVEFMVNNMTKLPKDIQNQMVQIIEMDPNNWVQTDNCENYSKLYYSLCKLNVEFSFDIKPKGGKQPNILFKNPIIVDKKQVYWIECRPYLLFDNNNLLTDATKIYNKFNSLGFGIILYTDIICSRSFLKKINNSVKSYSFLD